MNEQTDLSDDFELEEAKRDPRQMPLPLTERTEYEESKRRSWYYDSLGKKRDKKTGHRIG